jgi:WD40 repeat protein
VTTIGTARDTAARDSPYVGLTFYTQEDAAMFFGRDTARTVLISNLRAARLTLLYAQSGAGKSSLLRAGVAARLEELAQRSLQQRGSARNIPVVFSSWRDDPTVELIQEIRRAVIPFVPGATAAEFAHAELEEALEAAGKATDATLLVMLDQFEEYFLYRSRETRAGRFADEVAACVNQSGLRANFLISIREDAYSGLGDLFKGRIPNVYGNYLHLEHLSRDSARLAIEEPIASFNALYGNEPPVEIEPTLVDTVLDQLRPDQITADQGGVGGLPDGQGPGRDGDGIAAPYLQLVMKRLWERELSSGSRTLRLGTLQELGGADTIVRTHVDRALGGLADGEREAVALMLRHLVTPSGTKIALAASDLADYTGCPLAKTTDLLERLAGGDTRILRAVPPAPGGDSERRFEISHDLLAPTIVDWGRRQRAARLEQEKKAAEQQAEAEKGRAIRFRALAMGSVALLALAVFLLAYVFIEEGRANTAKHDAQTARHEAVGHEAAAVEQRNQAVSAQIAGKSEAIAAKQPLIGSQLAVAAWRIAHTREAHASMLNALAQPDQGVLVAGPGHVNAVAFSPDGETIAAAGADGRVRLWDVAGRRLIYTFSISDNHPLNAVAFSPDGKTLATAGPGGKARLWDLTNHLVAARHGTARLRWALHGQVGGPLITGAGRVTDVTFSRDGKILATAGTGGDARLWNARTHRQIRPLLKASRTGPLNSVAFSRDGKTLATAGADGTARLWNVRTHRQIYTFRVSAIAVTSVAFSPDGKTLATAGADGTVRLWDVATHQEAAGPPLTASAIPVYSVAFSPDGKMLASGEADGSTRLWDPTVFRQVGPSFRAGRGAANSVALSRDGKILATGDADGTARLWSVRTRHQISSFHMPGTASVTSVAFSPDGKTLATGDADGTARLWSVRTRHQISSFHMPGTAPVTSVAFSPDGKTLATGDADGTARLWNVLVHRQVGRTLSATPRRGTIAVTDVAFSPHGDMLVTGNADGKAQLWYVATQRKKGDPFLSNLGLESVAFSPRPPILATAGDDGIVRLWNDRVLKRFHTRRSISTPLTTSGPVYSVAFSPDGQTLATGGSDGKARLWDVATHNQIGAALSAGPGHVTDVAFGPDGRILATTSSDGVTHLWNVSLPRYLVGHLCSAYHAITQSGWGTYIGKQPSFLQACPPA